MPFHNITIHAIWKCFYVKNQNQKQSYNFTRIEHSNTPKVADKNTSSADSEAFPKDQP